MSVGMSVGWYVGRMVCRLVGMSVSWYVSLLVCLSVGVSVGWYLGRLVCQSIFIPVGWSIGLSVNWSVGQLACADILERYIRFLRNKRNYNLGMFDIIEVLPVTGPPIMYKLLLPAKTN